MNARAVRRKLYARELAYLRELTAELLAERDDLRERLTWAEDAAERWRDDALAAAGPRPGITPAARVVRLQ